MLLKAQRVFKTKREFNSCFKKQRLVIKTINV
jgi:hypothetical protein